MSMLDAFFNKVAFRGAKCKTLLKLTIPRIKLLRNRREIQLKQMRKEIAKLLENGQEATARIRVEHIIREENMMAAQEILELFCELVSVRLPIIETQRECPLDLKEAISSICFAAPRCADLPELQQVQMLFAAKYGKEFVAAATELMPDCGVNRQIIELLSIRAPSVETKLKLLKEIAEEHELDWDPAASETEFFKPHEDLLNGPNHFTDGSMLPLPKEKHEEELVRSPADESHEEPDSDAGFDSLDLPEVPKVSVRSNPDIQTAPEIGPHVSKSDQPEKEITSFPSVKADVNNPDPPISFPYNASIAATENRQFIPFMSPPSFSSPSVKQSEPDPLPTVFSSASAKQSEPEIALASSSSVSMPSMQSEPAAFIPSFPSDSVSPKLKGQDSSLSQTKGVSNVGLQDVLVAAQAAAESAERAAAAARAAANLAHIRISDLVALGSTVNSASHDIEFQENSHDTRMVDKPVFDQQDSFSYRDTSGVYNPQWTSDSPTLSLQEVPTVDNSPSPKEQMPEDRPSHVPQRLASLEDDPYFSYPNLFTTPESNTVMGLHPSGEAPRS
ncbi:uncharacterized protein [Typha latifolia]|uniref:uncharacterized protein n=1 Tax=Typha latifolia TaxID=4733 RepID=UPI003C2BB75A